jgi:environmental stress-induced protein Ves
MHVLYARDRVESPWKNGGGVTTEVAVFPPRAGLNDFGWRVSIAKVERGGPFSLFPQIDRKLGLLDGRMSLTIAERGVVRLSVDSPPVEFLGDVAVEATIDGAITDLNVMTRRGAFASRMTRRRIADAITFGSSAVTFAFPLQAVAIGEAKKKIALARGDALYCEARMQQTVPISSATDFYWIEIVPSHQAA